MSCDLYYLRYIHTSLHFGPVLEQVRWQRLMESDLKFRKQKNELNKGGETQTALVNLKELLYNRELK